MIDKRFSAKEFERLGRDSNKASSLHKELASEIAKEIHKVTGSAFATIANELRTLGHILVEDNPEYDEEYDTWSYAYRDLGNDQGLFDHKLRVHLDTQVCTGYPDEKTETEVMKEIEEENSDGFI